MLVLIGLLAINVILGIFFIHGWAWIVEVGITMTMIATVLLVAMEALHEPPLISLFAGAGFFWVGILVTLTMMDYLTR
jgi:cytochrome c oxidase subunit 4